MKLLGLTGWQAWLLLPGMLAVDWLARTYPLFVIRTGIGFSAESYLFWSAAISALFWTVLVSVSAYAWRRFWRWIRNP